MKVTPIITYDLVSEVTPEGPKQNKILTEVAKDYDMCLKAVMEKERLEKILKTLPS